MTTEHPMQPPPELADELNRRGSAWEQDVRDAYAAGADAQLEKCQEWLAEAKNNGLGYELAGRLSSRLGAAMRPKPPSLKQQALQTLKEMQVKPVLISGIEVNSSLQSKYEIIRCALEALPDD